MRKITIWDPNFCPKQRQSNSWATVWKFKYWNTTTPWRTTRWNRINRFQPSSQNYKTWNRQCVLSQRSISLVWTRSKPKMISWNSISWPGQKIVRLENTSIQCYRNTIKVVLRMKSKKSSNNFKLPWKNSKSTKDTPFDIYTTYFRFDFLNNYTNNEIWIMNIILYCSNFITSDFNESSFHIFVTDISKWMRKL